MAMTAPQSSAFGKRPRSGARKLRTGTAVVAVALVWGAGLGLAAPAEIKARASMVVPPVMAVSVSVNFSIQLPLADLSEKSIRQAQESGRRLFYRLSQGECKVLLETIAKTCRLSNLNVSTRLRERSNQVPMKLNLSGNSRYQITLKDEMKK